MDSTTIKDERLNPKSPEDIANDTAQLFCCSELSLHESVKDNASPRKIRKPMNTGKKLKGGVDMDEAVGMGGMAIVEAVVLGGMAIVEAVGLGGMTTVEAVIDKAVGLGGTTMG